MIVDLQKKKIYDSADKDKAHLRQRWQGVRQGIGKIFVHLSGQYYLTNHTS